MLLLTLLLWTSDPTNVEAAGRLDYVVSRCGVFGWEADDTERMAHLEQLIAGETSRSREVVIREFRLGVRYAFSREGEALEAAKPSGFSQWAAEMETSCDRIAQEHPTLLRRTPDTAARWAQLIEEQTD